MSEDEQRQHLHLIDTSESLTLDELRELKKIAQMSRTAKTFLAVTIALVALFGIDKLIELIKH